MYSDITLFVLTPLSFMIDLSKFQVKTFTCLGGKSLPELYSSLEFDKFQHMGNNPYNQENERIITCKKFLVPPLIPHACHFLLLVVVACQAGA